MKTHQTKRHRLPKSRCLKNTLFKNYAAYALTKTYQSAISKLIKASKDKNIVLMCSEDEP